MGNALNESHDETCRQRLASLLCQPNQVPEKPQERATSCFGTGPEPASSSSAVAVTETQLPTTDMRAVRTVDDSEIENGNTDSKRARTIGGMEVCVLDDQCDERMAR